MSIQLDYDTYNYSTKNDQIVENLIQGKRVFPKDKSLAHKIKLKFIRVL